MHLFYYVAEWKVGDQKVDICLTGYVELTIVAGTVMELMNTKVTIDGMLRRQF